MTNLNLMPEFGYLLNANNGKIEIISNSGYIAMLSHTLFEEKNTLLWDEANLTSLLFNAYGVTELNELNLGDDEQFELHNFVKANAITSQTILYSVDGCKFATSKIYPNRLEAAIAINQKHQFGLYYCRYSWDIPKFSKISPALDLAIEKFQSKLPIQTKASVIITNCDGTTAEMKANEFCNFVERQVQTKLFEAITFEEHLQQRFCINSIYELEGLDGVDEMTLKFYQNLFKKNISDYQAPMYFYTGTDLKPKSISLPDLQKLGMDNDKFRIQIAMLVANAQSELLQISSVHEV